jgi:hypothetical protein
MESSQGLARLLTDLEPGEAKRKSGGAVLRRRPLLAAPIKPVALAVSIATNKI